MLLRCCSNDRNRGVQWEVPIVSVQTVCQYAVLELSVSVIKYKTEHEK